MFRSAIEDKLRVIRIKSINFLLIIPYYFVKTKKKQNMLNLAHDDFQKCQLKIRFSYKKNHTC